MKQIELSQGLFAQVDDADYEWLNASKWHAHRGRGKTFYAKRNIRRPRDGKRTMQTMHEAITGEKGWDHKDGNGLNNQRLNLRPATAQQQARNRAKRSGTSCPYKGVQIYKTKKGQKYLAYLHLGVFDRAEDAARAYDRGAEMFFGEFARLNFTDEKGESNANFI